LVTLFNYWSLLLSLSLLLVYLEFWMHPFPPHLGICLCIFNFKCLFNVVMSCFLVFLFVCKGKK
jgi:hypothetical protein